MGIHSNSNSNSIFLLFSTALFFLLSSSIAVDTISANQTIRDGNTIVSHAGMFELGFFSLGNSNNRYLGIWYKKISVCTVVWVANRETPISDTSGRFQVSRDGNLMVVSGGNTVIWSSNSTLSDRNLDPVAQLLETGNLVVWDKSSTKKRLIWQSFDYFGDTLLPGMKFGKDLETGRERYLTPWKSPDDPSPGRYLIWVDTNGYPQILRREGRVLQSRLGPWNGLGFSGLPIDIPNPIYSSEFVVDQKEIYFRYELLSSVVQRIHFTWDGKTLQMHWIERTQEWVVYADVDADSCGRYAICGPYGSCNINRRPPCSCIKGFEPRIPEEWKASDWSSGCQRKKPLNCGSGDGFQKISGVKLPDTQRSWYNLSMTLGECEMACRKNFSCTAYANLDIRNGGSGCLLWFDKLMDIREYDVDQELYIRISASELATAYKGNGVLTLVLLTVLLLFAVVYACRKKKKRLRMKGKGNWYGLDKTNTSIQMEDLDELPFFSLRQVAKATDNFNINNKVGEGGFGPVYKGVLEDGQEVAVKRLSETSQQGLDEFKNEVICIAKLQHRNLVKLLGYCIHANELILIYEYMRNKSLDWFLYDETKCLMLDWPQRFHIIHGMARGILYIHQDSRLQIIHRDLKAGNILLDDDMNPKISDFGLARKFKGFDNAAKTKKVVGTYGYISPEYAVHGRFSTKSDVFSFGVLVLEIVSGKKNREFSHEDHRDNLLGHGWRLYKEDRAIELVSLSLRNSCIVSEVLRSIHVGLLCVQHHAEDRPTMLSVVLMLVSEGVLPQPKQPAFFTGESCRELDPDASVDECTITQLYAR
ncbi:G-type lectin S-receptor-like serine/threonine-protein kinase At4g27290 [Cynara cardunculus var. scolymus]|uniref:G-type lectin S-receptor-like serine/threonine-protein kinase At4g27290 n=1 Tax=Cynara cardunculus var. scolymus TaxID=59895 RepID=UPI000D627484|nr:G-type lectin S-receptor-like serine/threonine-protein kinase At4g27290 [Cynara cardunculus var. scolymus]